MATKATKTTALTYKARISKTSQEVEAEQLDLSIEQANLNFQQGILSLKGQLLTSEGEVKKAEAALNTANLAIENAKASKPGNIVQSLVNAKTAAKQAEVNLQAAQASYSELEEVFNFLVETQKELFS